MSAPATLPSTSIEFLARGLHADPFAVLGPHAAEQDGERGVAIRAFRPHAASIAVHSLSDGRLIPMTRLHSEGVFEAFLPRITREALDYQSRITWGDGSEVEIDD